jgi:sialate O-acetylesterase
MVLQQEAAVPVRGTADPAEKITVTIGADKAEGAAGADGKWCIDLSALPAGTLAATLTVSGKNTITIKDVLIGDVWLCSGQSNMEYVLRNALGGKEAVAQATDDQIRLFHVPHTVALAPRDQVSASWQVASPETVSDFSAVGYFFGKKLRSTLHRPIGLIESNFGGTPAEAWTDLPTLQSNPLLQNYIGAFAKIMARYTGGDAEFAAKSAEYEVAAKKMLQAAKTDPKYQAAMSKWKEEAAAAKAARRPIPSQPRVPEPRSLGVQKTAPTVLFNGMISPLIPFAIKGVIWYQGENNARSTLDAIEYATLFPAMITDWRKLWNAGDFPFLLVQLANYKAPAADWPHLRESQLKTLSLPNTGMAVIIDIGTGGNIHPTDKSDVALRLSLVARHIAYGEKLVYTGPIYESMKVEGDKIRVSFKSDSIGSGLVLGTAPWTDPNDDPVSKSDLEGFAVAGADKNWVAAQAKIDGDTVVVSSAEVSNPVAVRYAWADDPRCNFYNTEGLPASPFRTDDWEQAAPTTTASK